MIRELLEEIKKVRDDLVHTNNPHFQSLQNIIYKWETKIATKEIEEEKIRQANIQSDNVEMEKWKEADTRPIDKTSDR